MLSVIYGIKELGENMWEIGVQKVAYHALIIIPGLSCMYYHALLIMQGLSVEAFS